MNKAIEITIRNKVARIASSPIIVGKNKDYIVRFDFDEDWDKYDTKTARFSQDGEYQDIIFAGNECSMPALDGGKVVEIGVYAGDISTTTPAYLKVHKSIIDDDGVPADPQPDVYAQLMERLNELEAPAAVLYTVQNLTDVQKAQARDNIGVNESLGMTGATVGQVPVVKTVDENGAPTEWEAVELPSGAYIVNLTMNDSGNITADKTFAEIKAAYDDGKVVDAKFFAGAIVPLHYLGDSEAVFGRTNANSGGVFTADLTCTSDNVWSMSQDGFDAYTLGISGASVGQIVKIKTVDSSGVPTEWEAADMASGGSGDEWEMIADITTDGNTNVFTFTGLSYREIIVDFWFSGTFSTGSAYTTFSVNGVGCRVARMIRTNSSPAFRFRVELFDGVMFEHEIYGSMGGATNVESGWTICEGSEKINTFVIGAKLNYAFDAGSRIKIRGRK